MGKSRKGDIEVVIDAITGKKGYFQPGQIKIPYGDGQYKELSEILTDHEKKIKEIAEIKKDNLKTKQAFKKAVQCIKILVNQLAINNVEVQELINNYSED